MKTTNYTYAKGIETNGGNPQPNCFNRFIVQIADGRFFFSKLSTYIYRDYAESKECYEIVKRVNGKEIAVNLCNGFAYSLI